MSAPEEGWGIVRPGDRTAHYYRGSRSLCHRAGFYFGPLEPDAGGHMDEHKECGRKVKAERLAALAAITAALTEGEAAAVKAYANSRDSFWADHEPGAWINEAYLSDGYMDQIRRFRGSQDELPAAPGVTYALYVLIALGQPLTVAAARALLDRAGLSKPGRVR
jgi:hypothetical protein